MHAHHQVYLTGAASTILTRKVCLPNHLPMTQREFRHLLMCLGPEGVVRA